MVAFLFEAGESKGKSASVFGILFLFPDLFFRNHTEWYISTRSSIYPPPLPMVGLRRCAAPLRRWCSCPVRSAACDEVAAGPEVV